MIELLGKDLKPMARLENATNVAIEEVLNQPGGNFVSFDLPYNDPKFRDCYSFRFVKPHDAKGVEHFDPYRIMPRTFVHNPMGIASIECEHCITTLADDLLFGYHELGGAGYDTKRVLDYVLDKQTVRNWVLGVCEFSHEFQYGWENETLLQALYSIPTCFADDYQFTFETSAYPWTVNLIKLNKEDKAKSRFRYDYNINSVRKEEDTKELCNRLYCLGYGEGINQLTIESVNGGLKYIEDTASQAKYGIISRAFTDRSFEDEALLLARGQKLLSGYSKPRLSYALDAVDLFPISNNPMDKPRIGDVTIIEDDELEEKKFKSIIVSVKRSDLFGSQPATTIEVENTKEDLEKVISEQATRLHVEESYAQGATNIGWMAKEGSADQTHPLNFRFYIPNEARRINKVILRVATVPYRIPMRGMASGGSINQSTTQQPAQTSSSGGGTSTSTTSGGGLNTSTGQSNITSTLNVKNVGGSVNFRSGSTSVTGEPLHSHDLSSFFFDLLNNVIMKHEHDLQHTHSFYASDHSHGFTVPNHSHTIPAHSHLVIVGDHVHAFEYGIFEGPKASVVTGKLGGNTFNIPLDTDINIVDYLEKDAKGMIKRNATHILTLTPNGLTNIEAELTLQLFIQSRGGGNY